MGPRGTCKRESRALQHGRGRRAPGREPGHGSGTHRRTGLRLSRGLHLAVLLLQLLDLLQGEEGATAAGWLLRVPLSPLLKGVSVAAVHVEAQVLLVLGSEVTELTGKRLPSCRRQGSGGVPTGQQESRHAPGQMLEKQGWRRAGDRGQLFSPVCLTAM